MTERELSVTGLATTSVSVLQPHDPGIYFGMGESEYRADPSLGSSDERRVAKNPSDYWFGSWMNPARPPEKDTPAKKRGTAVHVLVLYGEAEFDRRYMRGAENGDDLSPAEKAANTKAANKKAAERGLIALPAQEYDNIAIASAMIAKNPKLGRALIGGANEVSIFWRGANGVPKKARTDCLKATKLEGALRMGIGDLKSRTNPLEKPFERACIDSIVTYRYDVQARHYMDGCANISRFVADGCVHGDHDPALLKNLAAAETMAFQFIWWQAEGAPITYSKIISPANPILEVAAASIARGDANYLAYMERFGTNMWLLEEEPSELYLEEMPPWFGKDF